MASFKHGRAKVTHLKRWRPQKKLEFRGFLVFKRQKKGTLWRDVFWEDAKGVAYGKPLIFGI
jgi:hypothetical protein